LECFLIEGDKPLYGSVRVGRSKNAVLPLMAASILFDEVILEEVPKLRDVISFKKLLEFMGAEVECQDECVIKVEELEPFAPYEIVRTMRASFLVLGPLLARYGRAKVSLPGGCVIGARPVDIHLKAFEQMGARINIESGYVIADAPKLKGAEIYLDFPSVGATENILLAASFLEDETVIRNAALEPEVADLANFLKKAGVEIEGIGTSTLRVKGPIREQKMVWKSIPDRIEAATLMMAIAITGGEGEVNGVCKEHMENVVNKLLQIGVELDFKEEIVYVRGKLPFKPSNIITAPYPGFPTDLQAQMMVMLTQADGVSTVQETIFENRFMHVPELMRMGADLRISGNTVTIKGPSKLRGAPVMVSDLRAGAALVIAGLAARGKTIVRRIYHIDRGYERLDRKLKQLGASVKRVSERELGLEE